MQWMPRLAASASAPWGASPGSAPSDTASAADQREHLVAPPLHVGLRDERLEAEAQQRLGVRRSHVEVPVVVVDRDAVEVVELGVAEAGLDLRHLRLLVGDLGVDLARDEVSAAQ